MDILPDVLVGHTLTGVVSSWHELNGQRSTDPVHVWLTLTEVGNVQLHTRNGLVINTNSVYDSYEMEEYGRIVVELTGPAPLLSRVGERIEGVSPLRLTPPGMSVGTVVHFQAGSVGIADMFDDIFVHAWPADIWARLGVSIETTD